MATRRGVVEVKEKLFSPVFEILDGQVRAYVASYSADGGKTYGAPKIEIRRVWGGTGQTGKREGLSYEVLSELHQKGYWKNLMEHLREATDRWSTSRYNPANQGGVERRRRAERPTVTANLTETQTQVAALTETVSGLAGQMNQLAQAVNLLLQQAQGSKKSGRSKKSTAKVAATAAPTADPFDDGENEGE